VPDADWSAPSSPTVPDTVGVIASDRSSEHTHVTVTLPRFQPNSFGRVRCPKEMPGAVRSMLIPDSVAEDVLPALSRQVPVADWPSPSLLTVDDTLGVIARDKLSPHDQVTATSPLFQSNSLPGVRLVRVITGTVVSMLIARRVLDEVLPATSVHVAVAPWSLPSLATVTAAGPVLICDSPSVQFHVTVTGPLFQTPDIGGVRVATVSVGSTESMWIPARSRFVVLPA
jgi:hypothetical protein